MLTITYSYGIRINYADILGECFDEKDKPENQLRLAFETAKKMYPDLYIDSTIDEDTGNHYVTIGVLINKKTVKKMTPEMTNITEFSYQQRTIHDKTFSDIIDYFEVDCYFEYMVTATSD